VDELKEAQVERQFLLRDPARRSQPGTQQRPEAFHGVDMDLMEAVTVLVTGILFAAVADGFVFITPLCQPTVNIVPIIGGKLSVSVIES